MLQILILICVTLAQTKLHCYRTHPERSQSRIIAPRDHRIYAHRLYNYVGYTCTLCRKTLGANKSRDMLQKHFITTVSLLDFNTYFRLRYVMSRCDRRIGGSPDGSCPHAIQNQQSILQTPGCLLVNIIYSAPWRRYDRLMNLKMSNFVEKNYDCVIAFFFRTPCKTSFVS